MVSRSRARQNAIGLISRSITPCSSSRILKDNSVQINTLVYARVSLAHKDMEPELTTVKTNYARQYIPRDVGTRHHGIFLPRMIIVAQYKAIFPSACFIMHLLG